MSYERSLRMPVDASVMACLAKGWTANDEFAISVSIWDCRDEATTEAASRPMPNLVREERDASSL